MASARAQLLELGHRYLLFNPEIIGEHNLLQVYAALDPQREPCVVLFVRNRTKISSEPRSFAVPSHRDFPSLPNSVAGAKLVVFDEFDIGNRTRLGLPRLRGAVDDTLEECDHLATEAAIALGRSLLNTNATNFAATSCGHRIRRGEQVKANDGAEAIVVYVLFKGYVPLGEPPIPATFEHQGSVFEVDVREGYYRPHARDGSAESAHHARDAADVLRPEDAARFADALLAHAREDDNRGPPYADDRDVAEFLEAYSDRESAPLGVSGIPLAPSPGRDSRWNSGTVGCYVQTGSGRVGVLSNAHVFFQDDAGAEVDMYSPTPLDLPNRERTLREACSAARGRAKAIPSPAHAKKQQKAEQRLANWQHRFPTNDLESCVKICQVRLLLAGCLV